MYLTEIVLDGLQFRKPKILHNKLFYYWSILVKTTIFVIFFLLISIFNKKCFFNLKIIFELKKNVELKIILSFDYFFIFYFY